MKRNTKKALGKSLPEILDEQLTDTRYCFDKEGNECEPLIYKEGDTMFVSSFIGDGMYMVVHGNTLVPETPEERVKRLNNELQGCF